MTVAGVFHEPGQFVMNPKCPEWGLGQIQSVVGPRVTVNFEHAGKILINTGAADLEIVEPPTSDASTP